MSVKSFLSIATLVAALGAHTAAAAVLTVSSYDMPNGDGTQNLGKWNYWDGTYTGSGAKTTDSAPLSGGTGALTDGVIANTGWAGFTGPVPNSNSSGTGLYVGWKYLDPTIVFNLAQKSRVFSIDVYADYAYGGLVGPPQSITVTVNGVTYTYSSGVNLTPVPISSTDARFSVSFLGGIVGSSFKVQLNAGPFGPGQLWPTGADATYYNAHPEIYGLPPVPGNKEPWMMVSEVQFNGEAVRGVPEPSTWALMLVGFATLGYISFRRQNRSVVIAKR